MNSTIRPDEKIVFALRDLYGRSGYARYTMTKFEEYDLYVRNKDFLISDSVITFTDTNGRLMALKPDVTLSIVKNGRDIPGHVQKLYYDENVYRVTRGAHSFREIMQVGLECIGEIDDFCILEVLSLAARCLKCVSENSVLNISHLGVISDALAGVEEGRRAAILHCIGEKNLHELRALCAQGGMEPERLRMLETLIQCHGAPGQVLPKLRECIGESPALRQLQRILNAFADSEIEPMLRIDFSVTSDMKYYNGVVFKGFVQGVPQSVLSGGQYDRLMRKMQRRSGAIGFAVYLDQLERLNQAQRGWDVDVLLLYDDQSDLAGLQRAVAQLNAQGLRVSAQRSNAGHLSCRRLARYKNGEVEILEEYA